MIHDSIRTLFSHSCTEAFFAHSRRRLHDRAGVNRRVTNDTHWTTTSLFPLYVYTSLYNVELPGLWALRQVPLSLVMGMGKPAVRYGCIMT